MLVLCRVPADVIDNPTTCSLIVLDNEKKRVAVIMVARYDEQQQTAYVGVKSYNGRRTSQMQIKTLPYLCTGFTLYGIRVELADSRESHRTNARIAFDLDRVKHPHIDVYRPEAYGVDLCTDDLASIHRTEFGG